MPLQDIQGFTKFVISLQLKFTCIHMPHGLEELCATISTFLNHVYSLRPAWFVPKNTSSEFPRGLSLLCLIVLLSEEFPIRTLTIIVSLIIR